VPAVVRNRALAAGAGAWLDGLAELVAQLERQWAFTTEQAFTDATEAYVAAVTRADGTPAVLKLIVPRDGDAARNEITALELADGRGCVRLLEHDAKRDALLLERLGPSLHDLGYPLPRRLEVLAATAMRVWQPAPDCGLPTGADKGRWLCEFVTSMWEELDHPCNERAVAYAIECATRRVACHDDERAVLVHGDVHEWNTLRADGGFKLVDPDGLLAEAEYDLGVMMREDPLELLADHDPRTRARWLGRRTGLDADAIWEWGVIERVSTGLLATKVGLQPIGRQMLDAADRVAL
jgi:streptomycin 6-kinase